MPLGSFLRRKVPGEGSPLVGAGAPLWFVGRERARVWLPCVTRHLWWNTRDSARCWNTAGGVGSGVNPESDSDSGLGSEDLHSGKLCR